MGLGLEQHPLQLSCKEKLWNAFKYGHLPQTMKIFWSDLLYLSAHLYQTCSGRARQAIFRICLAETLHNFATMRMLDQLSELKLSEGRPCVSQPFPLPDCLFPCLKDTSPSLCSAHVYSAKFNCLNARIYESRINKWVKWVSLLTCAWTFYF